MYKEFSTLKIILGSDKGKYKKLAYSCIGSTMICTSLKPEEACMLVAQIGKNKIEYLVKEVNSAYTIRVIQLRYNYSKTYQFRGQKVSECKAIATFDILWNNSPLSDNLAREIIACLLRKMNGVNILSI